jgi:hypothetical protein
LEEVATRTGHEVLLEVDNNISLIVGGSQGILNQQFRPHSIYLLNIITFTLTDTIKSNII